MSTSDDNFVFYIEDENTISIDDHLFEKDDTLANTLINKNNLKRRIKKIALTLSIALPIIAFSFFIFSSILNYDKQTFENNSNNDVILTKVEELPSNNPTSEGDPITETNVINPLLKIWTEAPDVISKQINISISKNSIQVTTPEKSFVFTAPENFVLGSSTSQISDPQDFTYLNSTKKSDYYYFADLAHSKFIENSTNFSQVEIPNSTISGSFNSNFGGENKYALCIVMSDSSGLMILSSDKNDITSIINKISVQESDR